MPAQCCIYIESRPLIYSEKQRIGFYIIATVSWNELSILQNTYFCEWMTLQIRILQKLLLLKQRPSNVQTTFI